MRLSPRLTRQLATTVLALLALGLGGCAGAREVRPQQMMERTQQRFADADTDHDGRLSRHEAAAGTPRMAEHFDEIDSDHDDLLAMAEILHYLRQRRGFR